MLSKLKEYGCRKSPLRGKNPCATAALESNNTTLAAKRKNALWPLKDSVPIDLAPLVKFRRVARLRLNAGQRFSSGKLFDCITEWTVARSFSRLPCKSRGHLQAADFSASHGNAVQSTAGSDTSTWLAPRPPGRSHGHRRRCRFGTPIRRGTIRTSNYSRSRRHSGGQRCAPPIGAESGQAGLRPGRKRSAEYKSR